MIFSPFTTALSIIGLVAGGGVITTWIHNLYSLSGYKEVAAEIQTIARTLRAKISRHGQDLVLLGRYANIPVEVRFSHDEQKPGLAITFQRSSPFFLSVALKGATLDQNGVLIASRDKSFDARFTMRTDNPSEAWMFIRTNVLSVLQKLCCSSQILFAVGPDGIVLSEMLVPSAAFSRRILGRLPLMAEIVRLLPDIPGHVNPKVVFPKKENRSLIRIALASGVVTTAVVIFTAARRTEMNVSVGNDHILNEVLPTGVLAIEAIKVPGIKTWRLANESDFDPNEVEWLRGRGLVASGRLTGDFLGEGRRQSTAYILVGSDGRRRIVLLVDNVNRYDSLFPYLGIATVVPKDVINRDIEWLEGNQKVADGDGLLLTQRPNDRSSGLVLFFSRGQLIAACPSERSLFVTP